jgi:hypothetical protein
MQEIINALHEASQAIDEHGDSVPVSQQVTLYRLQVSILEYALRLCDIRDARPDKEDDTLVPIMKFCPPGMQIKSPGGLAIDPSRLVAVEARGEHKHDRRLILHYKQSSTVVEFHLNVDGTPADHYTLMRNIMNAQKESQ